MFAGREGLDSIRRIAPEIPRLLSKDGVAAVEIGASQGRAARRLLQRDGLGGRVVQDLAGKDRAIILTWV